MDTLTYQKAQIEDFDDFYRIKADKENIVWGGFTETPNRENLYSWYQKQLVSNSRWIYLVYCDNHCCGFFYVDKHDDGTFEASSSGVLTEFAGKGIGTFALKGQMVEAKKMGATFIDSWVSEKNIGSLRRYEKLGWTRTKENEVKNLPLLAGDHKFYKWIKEL